MSLRNDEDFMDFSVTSEGKTFPCHRLLLAASSPVFKVMVKARLRENKTELNLQNIQSAVLGVLLEYMHVYRKGSHSTKTFTTVH